ncbi:MAG: ABC transporter substrate-binding protein [Candidatus Kryptonium sp.]|nr:ABC transporter substrate-binding protein [Candidatus Kryptonium sp.]MCX7762100.1 ABC transporter substrate-binding protein [Candidatus Kryptonium sp.]MDW8108296.1 ABC transporter substrate-binding protein [Candidatus Kryptonium sp.]
MVKFFRVIVFLIFFSGYLLSQGERIYNPIADSLFKNGVEFFKLGLNARILSGDTAGLPYFYNAYLNFDSVVSLGLNHRTTASYLMVAKSLCYLNRFDIAEKILKNFISGFPESEYIEDAFYTLGLIYAKIGDYKQSLLSLDKAIAKAKDDKSKYVEVISVVIDSIRDADLGNLEKLELTADTRYLIVRKVSDNLVSAGKIESAKRYISERLRYFQRTEFYEKLIFQINYFDRLLVRPKVKIGVLLPEKQSLSDAILKGIEIAVDEHNINSNPKVGVEVKYYTSRDVDQKLLSFRNSPDVIGIIGPIYSEDVELCARFGDQVKIPIISPTATSDGLTKLSNYIFQFNSNHTIRSRALAQFAIFALGLKTFIILAPNDRAIKPFVDAFVDEVTKNSGKIVAVQFYNPDETDLRPRFRNLILKLDSLKIPISEVGFEGVGLFAPISNPDFIGIISSQVYYHDLKVKILGNDVWNNFDELYLNRRYTDGVIFTSGQYVDYESFSFKNFAKLFKEKFGTEPSEFSVYGYDAAKIILKIASEGKLTSSEVYDRLKNCENLGVGRDVIFDGERVNKSVSILVFKDNLVRRLSQWTVNQ